MQRFSFLSLWNICIIFFLFILTVSNFWNLRIITVNKHMINGTFVILYNYLIFIKKHFIYADVVKQKSHVDILMYLYSFGNSFGRKKQTKAEIKVFLFIVNRMIEKKSITVPILFIILYLLLLLYVIWKFSNVYRKYRPIHYNTYVLDRLARNPEEKYLYLL